MTVLLPDRKTIEAVNDQVTLSRPSLSFTSSNWNRTQTVTVRATSMAATAGDNNGPRGPIVPVSLTVDNDPNNRDTGYDALGETVTVEVSAALPSVSITTSRSSLSVQEGSTGEYTVRLNRNPTQGDRRVF